MTVSRGERREPSGVSSRTFPPKVIVPSDLTFAFATAVASCAQFLWRQTRMNLTEARTMSMRLARLDATRRLAACFRGVFVGSSDLVCAGRLIA
jgi:glutamate-1-semialdehyde aminotransferase